MSKLVIGMVDKVNGEGFVQIGDATFKASRNHIGIGSLVIICDGIEDYKDDYENGEVFRVTDVEEYGSGTIMINKEWKDDPGVNIMLFDYEYTGLEPINAEALLMTLTMEAGVRDEEAKKFNAELLDKIGKVQEGEGIVEVVPVEIPEEDKIPSHCKGCSVFETCHGKKEEDVPEEYFFDDDEEEDEEDSEDEYYDEDEDDDTDYATDYDEEEDDEDYEYDPCEDCPSRDTCDTYAEKHQVKQAEQEQSFEDFMRDIIEKAVQAEKAVNKVMTHSEILEKAQATIDRYSETFDFNGEEAFVEFLEGDDAVIVAMVKREEDGKVLGIGYAQCSLDDEYFEEVGKVIAMFRAADKEPPTELIYLSDYRR